MKLYNGAEVEIQNLSELERILEQAKTMIEPGISLTKSAILAGFNAGHIGRLHNLGEYLDVEKHPVRSLGQYSIANMYLPLTKGKLKETLEEVKQYFHDAFIIQQAMKTDESLRGVWQEISQDYDPGQNMLEQTLNYLEQEYKGKIV